MTRVEYAGKVYLVNKKTLEVILIDVLDSSSMRKEKAKEFWRLNILSKYFDN